jgi:hypothetical protein
LADHFGMAAERELADELLVGRHAQILEARDLERANGS